MKRHTETYDLLKCIAGSLDYHKMGETELGAAMSLPPKDWSPRQTNRLDHV